MTQDEINTEAGRYAAQYEGVGLQRLIELAVLHGACWMKQNLQQADVLSSTESIVQYLTKEQKEGKREFRIAFQDDKHFIVHPLDADGTTLDSSI